MATIHLMVGFMGFGKTTLAKQLAKIIPAVRLTHDDLMVKLYGRNMPYAEFHPNYDKIDTVLWDLAEKIIKTGTDVIMDYGFWSHKDRENAWQRAKKITNNIVFHYIDCDLKIAKERIIKRSKDNSDELYIREDEFDTLAKKFEPWYYMDDYPVIFHNAPITHYIGNQVLVKIDRPLGSKHPKYGFEYPVNYGYVPFTKSGDGEELDAYVLMEDKPLKEYVGRCIGIVHRTNENDDKLIVVPEAYDLADELIEENIAFQEKWFKHILIRDSKITKTHFGVYGSIIKNGKILLIKKARGPYTGLYDLPGGGQEKGESYLETLTREIMEETGCEVIKAENKRFKSIVFSDFTVESGEKVYCNTRQFCMTLKLKASRKQTATDWIQTVHFGWI